MAFYASNDHRQGARGQRSPGMARAQIAMIVLALLGMSYNAVLAVINAHVMSVNFNTAAAVEIVLQLVGICLALRIGINKTEKNVLYFFAVFIFLTLAISILNQTIFVDGLRNMLIITVFTCLGRQADEKTIRTLFVWATVIVLAFLVYELADLDGYAALFKPGLYFASSRGIEEFEFDDTGLFKNTMGFEGRFSYGIFTGPRTSSLFLEQVSLANYAAVLCILLISLWPRLSGKEKLLHIATMVLIVVSNNTRATSLLILASFIGYYLYPRLPRYANTLLAPVFIVLGVIVYHLYPNATEDDFIGRTSKTGHWLTAMSPGDYFGMGLSKLEHLWDSGYPWLVTTTSAFGAIAFWLFVSFVIPQKTPAQIRCSYALTLYIFMNMLVSGNAIFSIKVSAALWLLIGLMSGTRLNSVASQPSAVPQPSTSALAGRPTTYALPLRQFLRVHK
jgi:hypothetical protein